MKSNRENEILRKEKREADGFSYEFTLNASLVKPGYKLPFYSVGVSLTDPLGNTTSKKTKEIFADVGKATSFFEKIVSALATPIDLDYIVEDELYR